MNDYAGRTIWLIGASSGIGAAVARELARRGAWLALSARNAEKLEALRQEISGKHISVPLDIRDAGAIANALTQINATGRSIDTVLVFAGTYEPMDLDALNLDTCRTVVDINLMGSFNVLQAVLPTLLRQRKAQIALCASVAGYRGLPHGQPYSASKAAVINLAESLKAEMRGTSVDVKLICPGFVRTELTDKNTFHMPALIEAEAAAKIIADGLLRRTFEIHFPKRFTLFMKTLRLLPAGLYFRIAPK